ncbi:endonuclease domain-containing protein [Streptomyces sp. SCSIO ZS0520]|uniref:endonuclease domain-containing protein n=1 Tax=Streptomyces sp. SCSIO ZS0520 TaxID=2892996 RepID=UPI0021D8BB43|nr:endonuclease domain-containing protein [Streptomyces sp. SCSIO ZS0520]
MYQVLKERQAALPDNETIGIMPLCRMRVLGSTREPDFLITYKGRAGVIEVDGPHHEGPKRASNDHSRTDLLINAGVEWVARLDVRDVKDRAEVEKFVSTFLSRLTRR